jgi:hypothetical protein
VLVVNLRILTRFREFLVKLKCVRSIFRTYPSSPLMLALLMDGSWFVTLKGKLLACSVGTDSVLYISVLLSLFILIIR